MLYLDNKNIDCFVTILKRYGTLSTSEIIHYASSAEFQDLCSGCRSGTDVISAGLILVEKELAAKRIAKGGYQWYLTK